MTPRPSPRPMTGAWHDALVQDVRQAMRALRQSRGHAAWIIGSLAIGMAVMVAALSLLNALLVRSYPGVAGQDQLVRISMTRNCGRPDCWVRMSSSADRAALRGELTGLHDLAAYTQGEIPAALPEARSLRALFTSGNYFELLGVRPAMGRMFDARDEQDGAAVVVLSHAVWIEQFGSDPAVIGRSIRVVDRVVEVVGVTPAGFGGIDLRPGRLGPDIWLPLSMTDAVLPPTAFERRQQERDLYFVGRVRADVDARAMQTHANVIAARLAATRDGPGAHARAEVRPVWMTRPELRHITVLIILPIPVLVLVIACVNAANLMLARGSQRSRELAIRMAIGAARGRIIRQWLIESGFLALGATVIAVPLASWVLDVARTPLGIPMPLDGTVLGLAVLTAAGTAIAFGLMPAVRATAQQPARVLGPVAASSGATPTQALARRALIVAQVALSAGLLATGAQLVATVRAQGGSAGTPGTRLLIAAVNLEPLGFSPAEAAAFYQRLLDGAARLPDVQTAALARQTAVWTFGRGAGPSSLLVWQSDDDPGDGRECIGGYVAGDLFDAVGLRLLEGRTFGDDDRGALPRVAIVNQTLAESLGGPVVGRIMRVAPRGQPSATTDVQIVGVVESAMEPRYTPDGRPVPKVYLPTPIEPEPALALYLRSRTTAEALAQPVRELVRALDPRVPLVELGSLDQLNERSFGPQLWLARAAAVLGLIGVLLATAGLYGVASYVVTMRSRELAIRMAIGARPRRVLRMVVGQSMRLVCIGLIIGGFAAYLVSRLIQAEYHGIHGMDAAAFGGSAVLFVLVMLAASSMPALRAARLDPVATLKEG